MTDTRRGKKKPLPTYDDIGRVPPQSVEMECAILGAILLDTDVMDVVAKDLSAELFYDEKNQIICEAILVLYAKNDRIDILTVTQQVKAMNKLEQVGGAYYIATLTNRIASSSNIEFHLKIIQQYSLRRSAIRICVNTIKKAYDDTEDVFDVYSELQIDADNSIKEVMHYEVSTIKKIHLDNLKEMREVIESGHKSGVECGLELVDELTSGWQKTDLIILAGRPSMGKTATAITMVIEPSINKGIPVAIFSCEMSNAQLGGRIQANLSGIDVGRIIKKQLDLSDVAYLEKASEKLLTAPLYIDDTPNISLTELKSKARRLHREKGIKLIVIDYLQLMRSGLNIQNREQEIAEISRGLKGLAKELDIPIIALSQLSRLVEGRSDKKPQLSDLRESGQIEQDADMVIFCYRPEYYGIDNYELEGDNLETKGLFLLLIAKHRNGELGEIPLRFVHHLAKLTNHPQYTSEESQQMPTKSFPPITSGGGSSLTPMAQNDDFLAQSNAQQKQEDDEKDDDGSEVDLPF